MRKFNPHATPPARALQAWQILIGRAMNRQTPTYQGLSGLMYGKNAAGVLGPILEYIARYCIDNELPPLTCLVVTTSGGRPGAGLPLDPTAVDEQRERVYQYDWYDIYPPSEADMSAALSAHTAS